MERSNSIRIAEVNPNDKEIKPHMHNMFMEVLMLTGIPGLIMVLFWTVPLIIRMIRFFFDRTAGICLAVKYLTVPLSGVLFWHLVEVGIFTKTDTFGKVFFLLCGVFLGYYRDLFPTSRIKRSK